MSTPRRRSWFIHQLAPALKKSVRTVRRYCELGLIPGAVSTLGGHWCGKSAHEMSGAERRAFLNQIFANIRRFSRGPSNDPLKGLFVGKLVSDKADDLEEDAYYKALEILPDNSEVEASEGRDWEPDPEVNFDRLTLKPGANIQQAQQVWNLFGQKKNPKLHRGNPIKQRLHAVGVIARTLLREGQFPSVVLIAAELDCSARQLYHRCGAANIRNMIDAAKYSEQGTLPEPGSDEESDDDVAS